MLHGVGQIYLYFPVARSSNSHAKFSPALKFSMVVGHVVYGYVGPEHRFETRIRSESVDFGWLNDTGYHIHYTLIFDWYKLLLQGDGFGGLNHPCDTVDGMILDRYRCHATQ